MNKSTKLIELLAAVKAGRVTVIRDQYGNIRGVGVNNPDLKVGEVGYVKQVGCGQVIGRTLEEMQADEKAMNEWTSKYSYCEVLNAVSVGEILKKPNWDESDVAYLGDALQAYVDAHREVRTVERTVTVNAPAPASRGRYENIPEELESLDVDELKDLKRTATRLGLNDIKNACRTALRHKGVNC